MNTTPPSSERFLFNLIFIHEIVVRDIVVVYEQI